MSNRHTNKLKRVHNKITRGIVKADLRSSIHIITSDKNSKEVIYIKTVSSKGYC